MANFRARPKRVIEDFIVTMEKEITIPPSPILVEWSSLATRKEGLVIMNGAAMLSPETSSFLLAYTQNFTRLMQRHEYIDTTWECKVTNMDPAYIKELVIAQCRFMHIIAIYLPFTTKTMLVFKGILPSYICNMSSVDIYPKTIYRFMADVLLYSLASYVKGRLFTVDYTKLGEELYTKDNKDFYKDVAHSLYKFVQNMFTLLDINDKELLHDIHCKFQRRD